VGGFDQAAVHGGVDADVFEQAAQATSRGPVSVDAVAAHAFVVVAVLFAGRVLVGGSTAGRADHGCSW
jgi:hypothetical protein